MAKKAGTAEQVETDPGVGELRERLAHAEGCPVAEGDEAIEERVEVYDEVMKTPSRTLAAGSEVQIIRCMTCAAHMIVPKEA